MRHPVVLQLRQLAAPPLSSAHWYKTSTTAQMQLSNWQCLPQCNSLPCDSGICTQDQHPSRWMAAISAFQPSTVNPPPPSGWCLSTPPKHNACN